MATSMFSFLKQRLYARFNHRIDNPTDRRRSEFFAEWIDVGFARHLWTNDGEIAPDVFRANNPNEKRFRTYAEQGIRTVVNLRNDVQRAPAKLAEERAKANGMTYVSYPLLPRTAPTKQDLLGLVELFPTLEKPVLFHCKSGADRTGLVAAIWCIVQEGQSLSEARSELSLRYIHRRDSETGVLDEVLDGFEPYEGELSFSQWVETHYDPKEAEEVANRNKPRRNFWGRMRHFYRDVYEYAQHREGRWHQSFEKEIRTEKDRQRAQFFMKWIDHGILRVFWHNHHQIGEGVYRSNHPTEKRFRKYADQGLKTVINLRGASMTPQYQLEKKICAELGLNLIDLPMNGGRAPSAETVLKLLVLFENEERPMLLHCKSGADRTGLVSALYKLSIGDSVPTAMKELSLRYVHLKNGGKGLLRWILLQFEADSTQHEMTLREWISTRYDPELITQSFHATRGHWAFPADGQLDETGKRRDKIASVIYLDKPQSNFTAQITECMKNNEDSSVFIVVEGLENVLPAIDGVTFLKVPDQGSTASAQRSRRKLIAGLESSLARSFDRVVVSEETKLLASR